MIKSRTVAAARWQLGALCAGLSALIGLMLLALPFGGWLAHLSYDFGFWWRADIPASEATIVYMDEESHRHLNQPWNDGWDRALHARLIERLTTLGARAIVFDILFAQPGSAEADAQLVASAKVHGRVAVAAIQSPHLRRGEWIGWEVQRAFPALTEVAASGIVEQASEDKAVRRHYLIAGQTNLPSLAWRAAELALPNPPAPARERWINYYGPPGFLPHMSYFEVFDPKTATTVASLISNKVVFVGALYSVGFTGGKSTDDFRTPYTPLTGRLSPGVEINATCYLNLARGDWLTRLPPPVEAGLILAMGALLGLALASLRPVRACVVAVLAAVLVGSIAVAVAWQAQVWFPWAIVALGQIPLALGCSVIAHSRRLTLERRSFEQALALASEGRVTTTAERESSARDTEEPAAEPMAENDAASGISARPGVAGEVRDWPAVPDHELIRRIGRGAYGEVWLARDLIGSFHAVKLLRLDSFKSAVPMETEFEGLRKFTPISRSHPGFVHILHVGRDESKGCLFYVMELADDAATGWKIDPESYSPRTLAGELARRGRLPLGEVLQVGVRLADALEHLHRHQLIHRDIKPANILFVKGEPKFADIGLVTDVASKGESTGYLGTPGRMAPEGPGSPAADVFSLGKVLYEAGLGMDVERFPELPKSMIESGGERALFDFNRVIMRACEVDLRRRTPRAAVLRDELVALQQRLGKTP